MQPTVNLYFARLLLMEPLLPVPDTLSDKNVQGLPLPFLSTTV